jgi:hypothetical protein
MYRLHGYVDGPLLRYGVARAPIPPPTPAPMYVPMLVSAPMSVPASSLCLCVTVPVPVPARGWVKRLHTGRRPRAARPPSSVPGLPLPFPLSATPERQSK